MKRLVRTLTLLACMAVAYGSLGQASAVAQPVAAADDAKGVALTSPCTRLMVDVSGSMSGFLVANGGAAYTNLLKGLSGRCGGNAYPFADITGTRNSQIWTQLGTGANPGLNAGVTDLNAAIQEWLAAEGRESGKTLILVTDNVADLEDPDTTPGTASSELSIECDQLATRAEQRGRNQNRGPGSDAESQRGFICALRDRERVAAASVVLTRLPFEGFVYGRADGTRQTYSGPRALAIYVIRSGQRQALSARSTDSLHELTREIASFLPSEATRQFPINPFNPMAQRSDGTPPARQRLWGLRPDERSWRPLSAQGMELPVTPMGEALEFRVMIRLTNGDMWQLNQLAGTAQIVWDGNSVAKPKIQLPIPIEDGSGLFESGVCTPLQSRPGRSGAIPVVSLKPGETVCPIMVIRLDRSSFADGRDWISELVAWTTGTPAVAIGALRIQWQARQADLELSGAIQSEWSLDAGADVSAPVPDVQGRLYRLNDILRMSVAADEAQDRSVAFSSQPIAVRMPFEAGQQFWAILLGVATVFLALLAALIFGCWYVFRTVNLTVTIGFREVMSGPVGGASSVSFAGGVLSRFGPAYQLTFDTHSGIRFFGPGGLQLKSRSDPTGLAATITPSARS